MLVMTIAIPATGEAQELLPLMSSDTDLADFGIEAPEDVLRGQVSVAYAPDGARLHVYFLRDSLRSSRPVPSTLTLPEPPTEDLVLSSDELRALWVWNTRELIDNRSKREVFLDFVERQRIDRIFLYLPAAEGTRPESGFIPFDGAELGPLLAELRSRGALAYALDGDPDYALPEHHEGVVRTVRRVAEHNASTPPEQHFLGVRYDVEPYLVRGFQGPRQVEILSGFVTLVSKVASVAREAGLKVGVDVPFWFDSMDEETGQPFSAVLHGKRDTVLGHLMTLVDDMAIMDYRTQAYGRDGALLHASGELSAAQSAGVGIFIGVETTVLLDEDLFTFRGPARLGIPALPEVRWIVLESRAHGGERIWFVEGAEALDRLAERTRGSTLRHWSAGRPARVAGDKQSFARLGRDAFDTETGQIRAHLGSHPAYLGLALHDYLGLKTLLGGR
jgi:hypothetical protein